MKKNFLKRNAGVTLSDTVVAIIILSLFVGVIGNLYYQILKNSTIANLNAMALYYSIKLAEDTDRIAYEEVTNDLNNNILQKYNMPENFNMTIDVENYSNSNLNKEDIIKKVKITVNYTYLNEQNKYEIEKLKIKEM